MLSLDGNLIVVFVIVWVLAFFLTQLFFKPVRRIRDQRERGIQENKQAYDEALRASEQSLQDIEQTIKQAKVAAESAAGALAAEASKEKSRLVSEISAECRSQVDRAKEDFDRSVGKLKTKLASEASQLAEKIETKFLN